MTELLERLKRLLAEDPTLAARLAALIGSTVITGDGNVVGDHNVVSVVKLSDGDYTLHAEQLHVTLSPDQLRSLLVSAYTPPPLPDLEIVPDPGPLPPGSHMRFPRNALFTGRVEPLKALARALLEGDGRSALVTQAVAGMGGVGKTQLAVEFAYRYGRFFHGVHWVNAGEPEGMGAEVAACGEAMGLPGWPEKQPEQVARTLGEWQRGGPRLVVLDNLEEVGAAREWLARLSGGAVRVLCQEPDVNVPLMFTKNAPRMFTKNVPGMFTENAPPMFGQNVPHVFTSMHHPAQSLPLPHPRQALSQGEEPARWRLLRRGGSPAMHRC